MIHLQYERHDHKRRGCFLFECLMHVQYALTHVNTYHVCKKRVGGRGGRSEGGGYGGARKREEERNSVHERARETCTNVERKRERERREGGEGREEEGR